MLSRSPAMFKNPSRSASAALRTRPMIRIIVVGGVNTATASGLRLRGDTTVTSRTRG